jgi:hypothetical protein
MEPLPELGTPAPPGFRKVGFASGCHHSLHRALHGQESPSPGVNGLRLGLAPTDCELRGWRDAGLRQPSFFLLFPATLLPWKVRLIGRLSESDWSSVRACFKAGFGID